MGRSLSGGSPRRASTRTAPACLLERRRGQVFGDSRTLDRCLPALGTRQAPGGGGPTLRTDDHVGRAGEGALAPLSRDCAGRRRSAGDLRRVGLGVRRDPLRRRGRPRPALDRGALRRRGPAAHGVRRGAAWAGGAPGRPAGAARLPAAGAAAPGAHQRHDDLGRGGRGAGRSGRVAHRARTDRHHRAPARHR